MKRIAVERKNSFQLRLELENILNHYSCNDIILTGQLKPLKFAMYSKKKGCLISDYMTLKELYYFSKGLVYMQENMTNFIL